MENIDKFTNSPWSMPVIFLIGIGLILLWILCTGDGAQEDIVTTDGHSSGTDGHNSILVFTPSDGGSGGLCWGDGAGSFLVVDSINVSTLTLDSMHVTTNAYVTE